MWQPTIVCRPVVSPRGQTMVEYAMILAAIAVICVALLQNGATIVTALVSHVDPLL